MVVVVNYEVGGDFCEGGDGVEMESLSCGEDEVMNGMNNSRHTKKTQQKNMANNDEKSEVVFKGASQEYAQVIRMVGNGRCHVLCTDGAIRLCQFRGKVDRKVWIAAGDIVLVGLCDHRQKKAVVIVKYMPDEARLLKAHGELPESMELVEEEDEAGDGAGDDFPQFITSYPRRG